MSNLAAISLYDHQDVVALTEELLDQFTAAACRALPLVLKEARVGQSVLSDLEEVEISIIDDTTIADVHLRFMDIPDATDVITFEHGEIHISVETARAQAREYGNTMERELVLYVIHGLLHLAGYEDALSDEAAEMDRIQQSILNQVWQ